MLFRSHAWGTKGYVMVEGRSKLKLQVDPTFFVGYDKESKGYQMYWPNKHTVSTEWNIQWTDRGPVQLEGETLTSVNQAELQTPPTPQDPVLPMGLQTH